MTQKVWTLNPARSTRVDLIDNAKGEAVGEIVWVDVRNPADARLIVAAPELLDALLKALPFVEDHEGSDVYKAGAVASALQQIRAAIAKAT